MRRGRVTEHGRTRILTTRERWRTVTVLALALLGAAACLWIAAAAVSWFRGDGWTWPTMTIGFGAGLGSGLLNAARDKAPLPVPFSVTWPAPFAPIAMSAAPLWTVWIVLIVRPVGRKLVYEPRLYGLALPREIATMLGERAVRRTGGMSWPASTAWTRLFLPTTAFALYVGAYLNPHLRTAGTHAVWAHWERRVRIIARTGWGKTTRLLIPITRDLPGAALVTTTEPGLFQATVRARQFREPMLRWPRLARLARTVGARQEYPIAIFDLSGEDIRFTEGFPGAHWTLIPGCARPDVATRRAKTLIQGVDAKDHRKGSETDMFFRDSAQAVLAAWLHAAALDARGLNDLAEWLTHTTTPVPRRILSTHAGADEAMAMDLDKHLDPRAGRTTSGVERYITLALSSVIAGEGRRICGAPGDSTVDFAELIRRRGTVYILCDEEHAAKYRPLLGLLASEWYLAAEAVALSTRQRSLEVPAIGIHDEMRYGVPLPILPYVANTGRKYNISYLYAVQSASHEEEIFGGQAPALRAAASMTIIGGLDMASIEETSAQAGRNPIVLASEGTHHNQVVQEYDAWRVADSQTLRDGECVISVPGLRPFLAYAPSYREKRSLRQRINTERSDLDRLAETSRRQRGAIG